MVGDGKRIILDDSVSGPWIVAICLGRVVALCLGVILLVVDMRPIGLRTLATEPPLLIPLLWLCLRSNTSIRYE
jgi:hypothetical protein